MSANITDPRTPAEAISLGLLDGAPLDPEHRPWLASGIAKLIEKLPEQAQREWERSMFPGEGE